MAVDSPLGGLFFFVIGLILLLIYGRFIEISNSLIYGQSIATEKIGEEKSTLATHDEAFINGMVWGDVGRGQ